MRTIFMAAAAVAMLALPAQADSQAFCEIFAKDFADGRTSDVDQWQKLYRGSFADCQNQYAVKEASPPVEKPAAKKVVENKPEEKKPVEEKVKEKVLAQISEKPKLEPGSDAWNEYCAAKYTSFKKETGTYLSRTGKKRRCLVTAN
jgi:hypothetical protein